jgi:hypothetical protein
VESCFAKTTFAKSHDGRPLSYEAGWVIHHSLGHDPDKPMSKNDHAESTRENDPGRKTRGRVI